MNRHHYYPARRNPSIEASRTEAMQLADGRTLKYEGATLSTADRGRWSLPAADRAAELRVTAAVDPTPHGDLLHLTLEWDGHSGDAPDLHTLALVKQVFFGEWASAVIMLDRPLFSGSGSAGFLHIWQTPQAWTMF